MPELFVVFLWLAVGAWAYSWCHRNWGPDHYKWNVKLGMFSLLLFLGPISWFLILLEVNELGDDW